MKTALTIAGSDCSGGAGIQADLKTFLANGVYGMSVITALTAQNTTGVSGIMEVTPEFLALQLTAVFEDIPADAVKIGMLSSPELIEAVVEKLREYKAINIVIDPVMIATSGASLSSDSAVNTLKNKLLPLATLITPNMPEAQVLSGIAIHSHEDMEYVALKLQREYGCAVLLKGGHSISDADDYLCTEKGSVWLKGKRIANPNTHGTGCTLSSAIAANLAKSLTLEESVILAKEYITGALSAMLDLGKGSGPMNHAFLLDKR